MWKSSVESSAAQEPEADDAVLPSGWLTSTSLNFQAEADNPLGAFFPTHSSSEAPLRNELSGPLGRRRVHSDAEEPRPFSNFKSWSGSALPQGHGGRRVPSTAHVLEVVKENPVAGNARVVAAGEMLEKFKNDRRKEVHRSCVAVAHFGTTVARGGGVAAAAGFVVIMVRRLTGLFYSRHSCSLLGLGMGLSGVGLGCACCGILVATTVPPDEVDWLDGGGVMTSRTERIALSNNLAVAAALITTLLLLVGTGFGLEGSVPSHAFAAFPMVVYLLLRAHRHCASEEATARPSTRWWQRCLKEDKARSSSQDHPERDLESGGRADDGRSSSPQQQRPAAATPPPPSPPPPPPLLVKFPTALSCTLVLISLASAAIPLRWATASKRERERMPYLLEDTSYPEFVWWVVAGAYLADACVSGLKLVHLVVAGGRTDLVPSKNALGLVVGAAVSLAESGHNGSLLAYEVFTQSALVNGFLCVVVSVFLLVLGSGSSGFMCVQAPALLLVCGLLVASPAVAVTVLGRPRVFRLLMNRFELSDSGTSFSFTSPTFAFVSAFDGHAPAFRLPTSAALASGQLQQASEANGPVGVVNEGKDDDEEEKNAQGGGGGKVSSPSSAQRGGPSWFGASPSSSPPNRPAALVRSASSRLSVLDLGSLATPPSKRKKSIGWLGHAAHAEESSHQDTKSGAAPPEQACEAHPALQRRSLFKRSHKDGAFVAELLDSCPVTVGLTWWVHREEGDTFGERFKDPNDHRRHWRKGRVVAVKEDEFTVELLVQSNTESNTSFLSLDPFSPAASPEQKVHRRLSYDSALARHQKQQQQQQQPQHHHLFPSSSSSSLTPSSQQRLEQSRVSAGAGAGASAGARAGAAGVGRRRMSSLVERAAVRMNAKNVSSEELLALAAVGLRCIDWDEEVMERLLLGGAVCGEKADKDLGALFDMSRPLKPGETIDYFMSHSWHDEGEEKLAKLKAIVRNFKRRKKRNPTFWLDKVCIDQANIGDGLKVLPINIMACRRVLVLCGPTYTTRLWCVWELCTLLFVRNLDEVLNRVELVYFGQEENEEEEQKGGGGGEAGGFGVSGSGGKRNSLNLESFKLSSAHCYDPNEEGRLRDVIQAVGEQKFKDRVHELARAFRTDPRILERQRRLKLEEHKAGFAELRSRGLSLVQVQTEDGGGRRSSEISSTAGRRSSSLSLIGVQDGGGGGRP